jgi:hypothetical protein
MVQSDAITLPLAPLTSPVARANLGIKLVFSRGDSAWDYYLEYVIATGMEPGRGPGTLYGRLPDRSQI